MRTALIASLAVLVLGGTTSLASAQTSTSLVTKVIADFHEQLRVDSFLENTTLYAAPSSCPSGSFTVADATNEMRFSETGTESGCGEMGRLVAVPHGQVVYLVFDASRTITQATTEANAPVDAPQTFRLYDAGGARVFEDEYFSASAGSAEEEIHFYEIARFGGAAVNATWFFQDRGYSPAAGLPNLAYGQRFVATVRDPRLVVTAAPLQWQDLGSNATREGDTLVRKSFVEINVQPLLDPLISNLSIAFVAKPGVTLVGVQTPNGTLLGPDSLTTRVTGEGTEVRLSEQDVTGHGLGNSILVFESRSPLPPPPAAPPPPAPISVYPFAWLLLALPAVPAAMATRTTLGLRRAADSRHRPFVSHVFGVDVAFLALYLGLFAYVLAGERLPHMALLPIGMDGWVLYAELFALTAIFLFLWVAPTRHLVVLMRRDLALSEEAQEQLRRSNRELEQFAYIASHDLQEPLRTIAGFSEILRSKYGKELGPKGQQYLQWSTSSAKRMQNLIQGLLAYSRVDAKPLTKVKVDLNAVLADVLHDVDRLRIEQGGTIHLLPLPTVDADPLQMRQVFLNLVQNALKYRDPKRAPEIWITAERDHDYHILSVRDNGRGIPPEQAEKVFDMFERLEGRDSPIEGTGLGLAVVKKIVARHEGRIWVDAVPGGGSIFRIKLPRFV